MSRLRQCLRMVVAAVKVNLLPGLLLQCLMAVFFTLYIAHDGTRRFLGEVARVKQEAGFSFALISYVVAGALLPEILRIVFFQSGKPTVRNLRLFLTAAPLWGLIGVLVDIFYRCQTLWFGAGSDWKTLGAKILVDQGLLSPFFLNPLAVAWFLFRDQGLAPGTWKKLFSLDFLIEGILPVQVAGWMVWIPGLVLVYSMPELMQIPVAVLIQVFWVLVFTTLEESAARRRSPR